METINNRLSKVLFLAFLIIQVTFLGGCLGLGERSTVEGEVAESGETTESGEEAGEDETNPCEDPTEDLSCWFRTGQEADLLLGGIDFNNTGGPLLFNHPMGIESDGKRLVLLDSNNNRALVWNTLPEEDNRSPDLVLGQKDFNTNDPSKRMDGLNWPTAASISGEKLVIADAENNRILIWNAFPTESGQVADLVLSTPAASMDVRGAIIWPWGVWTDGERLVVASTEAAQILIWNSFPTQNNQAADIAIKIKGEIGTPRGIACDGQYLIVGDHNGFGSQHGSFVWLSLPTTENQPYDFFIKGSGVSAIHKGRLLGVGNQLSIWNSLPQAANVLPDLSVGARTAKWPSGFFFGSVGGEGQGITSAGEAIFIASKNGNKVVVYRELPTTEEQLPDIVIGAPDLDTNTLETNYITTNPIPATDGKSLFVSSDFDKRLYVWREIPKVSGTAPDFVIEGRAHWDNHLFGNRFAGVGGLVVEIWDELPLNGEEPSRVLSGSIGSVQLKDVRGVAFNEKYFFLSDYGANKVYIWSEVPAADSEPLFSLDIQSSWRITADNDYLIVTMLTAGGKVLIYPLDHFSEETEPFVLEGNKKQLFNMTNGATVREGHLAISDTGYGRVLIWTNINDAMDGQDPDVILGATGLEDRDQEIGRDKLFWPAALAFDGLHLWVGETKFSGRLARFTVQPNE